MKKRKVQSRVKTLSRAARSSNNKKEKNLFLWVALILLVVGGFVYYVIAQNPAKNPSAETRDMYKWPFDKHSPWNMPIGSKANYVQASIKPYGYTTEREIISVDPTAPVRSGQNRNSGLSQCGGGTKFKDLHVSDGFTTPIANTTPGAGYSLPNNSGAILVADSAKETIQEGNYIARCSGDNNVYFGRVGGAISIKGSGIDIPYGGGHGGSAMSGFGGSLRKWEVDGADPIRHALKITVNGKWLSSTTGGRRWPATNTDGGYDAGCSPVTATSYCGTNPEVKMGSLMVLHKDVDINSLGLTSELGKRVAKSIQDYGAYIVDMAYGVSNLYTDRAILNVENGASLPSGFDGDVMKIFDKFYVVANNTQSTPGGCALSDTTCVRRQPYAPDFGQQISSPTPSPQATQQPVLTTPTPTPTSVPTQAPTPTPTPPTSGSSVLVKVVSGDPTNGSYAVQATTTITGDIRVEFYIDGASAYKQRENDPPYSLFGDANGVLTKGTLGQGVHTIEARVYNQNGTTVAAKGSISVTEGSVPGTGGSVIEAETFKLNSGYKDPGNNLFNDSSASGGKGFIVWSPGNATVNSATSFSKAIFRVKADVCDGNPKLTIKINGTSLYSQEVSNTYWHDITVNFAGSAGATLRVELSNDLYKAGVCDRNLRFDKVTLQ